MEQAHASVLRYTLSIAGPMSLNCAVRLGIPDIIHNHGRAMTLHELAGAAKIPPEKEPALCRLMRLLVVTGVFAVKENMISYELTPFSKLLIKDGDNMSPYIVSILSEFIVKPWHFMSDWFLTADHRISTPFEMANKGCSFWDVTSENGELGEMFNEGMAGNSRWVMKEVVGKMPEVFRGVRKVVDVGGGNGAAAAVIAEAYPEVECTVLELAQVVKNMPERKKGHVIAVQGDMFNHVPAADAVLLKNVLHDWSDEECVQILKVCKKAIPSKEEGGKIIIIDIVLDLSNDNLEMVETHLFFDIAMLIGDTGRERQEHEWKKIFTAAGFENYKILPLVSIYSIIELCP